LPEIFKMKNLKNKIVKEDKSSFPPFAVARVNEKGVVLIVTFLVLGLLLLLGSYFLSFAISESKISKSQGVSLTTYYLAEAGINEAIWKLKNDDSQADGDAPWKICFTSPADGCPDCDVWQDSFVRNYSQNSTTSVSIQNSQCARGEIIATSTVSLPQGKTARRVVKVKVLKAFGSLTKDSPIFAGSPSGESTIRASEMNVYDGNIFSNNNINIKFKSEVNVYDNQATDEQEGQVLSVQNINITWSVLNASSSCAKNYCTEEICEKCPVDSAETPALDFDSEDSNSYKSKAEKAQEEGQCRVVGKNSAGSIVLTSNQCIFNEVEFEDLLWEVGKNGILILEHKTNGTAVSTYYIEGGINLKGGRELEVNGILVADETINIGEKYKWKGDSGFNQLTIIDPGQDIASGLLTKAKMNFGPYSSFQDINIKGLIYSQDEMKLTSIPYTFEVVGGIIARKFSLTSGFSPLNIHLDNAIIREGIWGGPQPPGETAPPYSPVVTVEHWEESY